MRLLYIIPNYSTTKAHVLMLEKLLFSIQHYEPQQLSHTLIIDDASPLIQAEDELRKLQGNYKVNCMFQDSNQGYSKVINMGMSMARLKGYDGVVTINSDVELLGPISEPIKAQFQIDPKVGIIGGRLLYPTGRIQHAGVTITGSGLAVEHDKHNWAISEPGDSLTKRYVHCVTGALQAIRLSVGRYSEDYELCYEDVEFCLRAWLEGWKVLYCPGVFGIHSESATRGYLPSSRELRSWKQFYSDFTKMDYDHIVKAVAEANLALQLPGLNPPSPPV